LFFKIIARQHLALMGLATDDGFDAGLGAPCGGATQSFEFLSETSMNQFSWFEGAVLRR
jgi:hypothetical protein